MHVDLFFCGDSVTYGMELEPEHEEYRFSNLVATDKNLTHYNRSLSGACNDWIVKHAIRFFRERNTCDTAIIQFSAPERWNFYDTDSNKFMNIGNKKTINNLRTAVSMRAHKAYYQSIWSDELCLENYWKNVFLLDNYLKDKCKTIYLTLGYPVAKLHKNIRYNDWGTDFEIASCKNIVGESRLIGHPSKEGHRKIADYVISKL